MSLRSSLGCDWILVKANESDSDLYPQLKEGQNIELSQASNHFVTTLDQGDGHALHFLKDGCYGFGLWVNFLPSWTIDKSDLDKFKDEIDIGNLDPVNNPDDARTVLANYVRKLLDDGVDPSDLDDYISPGDFSIEDDLFMLVRIRDGEETLIVSTFGTRIRTNKDPKSANLHSVEDIKKSYLGAPIITERYYHVQEVKAGDKFVYRSRDGTIRLAKEEISTKGNNATVANFNPLFLYITNFTDKDNNINTVYI
jgi:hypothetical protein